MSPLPEFLSELSRQQHLLPSPAAMFASASRYLTGLLTLQVAVTLGSPIKEPCPEKSHLPPRPKEAGHLGAVASESDICSHIGTSLLELGGNAADAMVGTVACVGVVGMYHSGE